MCTRAQSTQSSRLETIDEQSEQAVATRIQYTGLQRSEDKVTGYKGFFGFIKTGIWPPPHRHQQADCTPCLQKGKCKCWNRQHRTGTRDGWASMDKYMWQRMTTQLYTALHHTTALMYCLCCNHQYSSLNWVALSNYAVVVAVVCTDEQRTRTDTMVRFTHSYPGTINNIQLYTQHTDSHRYSWMDCRYCLFG